MKKLKEIIECSYEINIIGVTDDSRNVKKGFLFVATKGYYVDHYEYISDAIKNGASCVVCDRNVDASIPIIIVDNINDVYIDICEKFYDVSSEEFSLIGITGTDGKTTTTTIIQKLLNNYKKTACIGTNGVIIEDTCFSTNNTTPCICELYNDLKLIKDKECKNVVMEVSSEALLHERVKRFKYDVVGITNITEDHLNVHGTLENYRICKMKLLNLVKDDGIVVINGDDENCKKIDNKNLYTFGFDSDNDYVISNVNEMSNYVNFSINYSDKIYEIKSPFLGMYNVYNVTMAFVVCLLSGIDSKYLIEEIKKLSVINGRREMLYFGQKYDIILDYAHTYNGIKSILDSVKNYKKIITVTGAAGGREKEKRRKIGKLIMNKSDLSIFTMDDPRFESVDDIIDEMVSESNFDYIRIIDRKQAIFKALDLAKEGDVVMILGKGRDSYMAIGDKKLPYCDYDVICEYFGSV